MRIANPENRRDLSDRNLAAPVAGAAPRLLSARAAAAAIGVSERTIRRAIAQGALPATKNAGMYRIASNDLARYRLTLPESSPAHVQAPDANDHSDAHASQALSEFRPWPIIRPPPLPVALTSLVGRRREVKTVSSLILREDVRLVTLTGPAGVGKTRLALRVASDVGDDIADGVAFVPLASITDPELVLSTTVRTLNLPASGGRPPLDRLLSFLRAKAFLLVLDNLEQVVDCGPVIAELLSACPRLTVLATSRIPLHISGEHEFPVPPLAIPPRSAVSLQQLRRSAAVNLFRDRTRAVVPDFSLCAENISAVAEICRRLDGLPLAIELAAVHGKVLSPAALLARLERRLPLLTDGPHDQPERLQTMRHAIAWSYDLLDQEEQVLFRRLSVFAGGCTLAAAEAVTLDIEQRIDSLSHSPPVRSNARLLTLLSSLVDKNLLRQTPGADGEPRFSMLQTIREYGLEQLTACGEAPANRQLHATIFLALAESSGETPHNADSAAWRETLLAEFANFRAAHQWFVQQGAVESALRLIVALEPLWWIAGDVRRARRSLEDGLATSDDIAPGVLTKALIMAAELEAARGDFGRAMSAADRASSIALAHDDAIGTARATEMRGMISQYMGQRERARRELAAACAHYRALDDRPALGHALCQLATLGDLGAFDRSGDPADLARSTAYYDEALAIFRETGDSFGIGTALTGLGNLAYYRHDYLRAFTLTREALALRWELHDLWEIPATLEDLADIAAMSSQPTPAAHIYGAAEALRETLDKPIPPSYREEYEREVARTSQQMGDDAFTAAWATGRALPVEQAVAEALAITINDDGAPTADEPAPEPGVHLASPSSFGLTQRELQVLQLLADGRTDQEIADTLGIAYRTTTTYVTNILTKLDVPSRTAAATYAVRHRLI